MVIDRPSSCGRRESRLGAQAFTLIELTAVLVILALLSAAAVVTFGVPLQRARSADAVASLRSFDAYARQAAGRFNRPSQIIIDLDRQMLTRTAAEPLHLPQVLRIAEVRLAAHRQTSGQVKIPCSAAGLTPSYGLHLTGPETDRWILVAGLSGQITEIDDERSLDNLLRALSARRDAD